MAVRFVRPRRAEPYGTGSGTSYANAWNGFGSIIWGELNELNVPSTLWVCGWHRERLDLVNGGSLIFGGTGFRDRARHDGLRIRGDFISDFGIIDVRELFYTYLTRNLTDAEIADLTQWLAGTNSPDGAYCASIHLRSAQNVTVEALAIYASKVPLTETPEMNPAITSDASGATYAYDVNTAPRPCAAPPYNGASILYPRNEAIVSDTNARNIRVTRCRIMGDGRVARKAVAVRAFQNASRVLIDRNDISGFLRGVQVDAAGLTLNRVSYRIRRNRIHDLGFAAYDDFGVDGVRWIGDFSQNGCYAEAYKNDISGYTKNAVVADACPGVHIKANFCHDQKRQTWNYGSLHSAWGNGTTPIVNVDETRSRGASGIVGGTGGSVIGNTLLNAGGTHGISNGGSAGSFPIAGNLIISTEDDVGANGISLTGSGEVCRVFNNTSVGYKRAARLTSSGHTLRNNILARGAKASTTFLNGSAPVADLLVDGSSGHELSHNCYASGTANKVAVNGGTIPGSEDGALEGVDPLFRRPQDDDYRLSPDSPCLGTGIFPGIYFMDANGTPFNLPVDIGGLSKHAYQVMPRNFLEDQFQIAPDPAIVDPGDQEPPPVGEPPDEPDPLPLLVNLSPSNFELAEGASATIQVTVSPAPASATPIPLTNSNPGALQAPSSVTVQANQTTATFQVTGLDGGTAVVTATLNGTTRTATVSVEEEASPPPPPTGWGDPNYEPTGAIYLHSFENSVSENGHWSLQAASSNRRTNPIVPGAHGSRCVQLRTEGSDTGINGSGSGERCDMSNRSAEGLVTAGMQQFWAHSVRFPSDGFQRGTSWFVWWQWHAANGGTQPTYSLHFPGGSSASARNRIRLRVHGGNPPSQMTHEQIFFNEILLDTWYDFIEHFVWSPNPNTGRTRVWVRRRGIDDVGALMCDVRGPNMYNGDDGNYLKPSNYHGDQISGGTAIQHDRIAKGATLASVQWFDLEGIDT